jgi:UDP-N-acetylmuramate dehydrogenase
VIVLGAASNVIVRDGGIAGVVIRLGPSFGKISTDGLTVTAGAAALDGRVSVAAANAGIAGLEFFSGVPGTIGGALRMNAGCYGSETKDVLVEARALTRSGERVVLSNADFHFTYRHTEASEDLIFVEALFRGSQDEPAANPRAYRGAEGAARDDAADPREDGRVDVCESRSAGNAEPALVLEADRRGWDARASQRRGAGERASLQLPAQHG